MSKFKPWLPGQDDSDEEGQPKRKIPRLDDDVDGEEFDAFDKFQSATTTANVAVSEEEEDPLDAFMANVNKEVKELETQEAKAESKSVRQDIEDKDEHEELFEVLKEREKELKVESEGKETLEELQEKARTLPGVKIVYDLDKNPILIRDPKYIESLKAKNHDEENYVAFRKNFYIEHKEVAAQQPEVIAAQREKDGIVVTGTDPFKPLFKWEHCNLDYLSMRQIEKLQFQSPTLVQREAIPAILSGRDVKGIAKTGSGKTLAFVLPMIVHITGQINYRSGDGPLAMICAPTRELAEQIYKETKRFTKAHQLYASLVVGGMGKYEQVKEIKKGVDVVIGTPGRLIDVIKAKALHMDRITYLVLDEADRMFELGFEPQIKSILGQVRPDRQLCLFTATFNKKIEWLASEQLNDPVRISVGRMGGQANDDVVQLVEVLNTDFDKWNWLIKRLGELILDGLVLIFVSKKDATEELGQNLKKAGFNVGAIHGNLSQDERSATMSRFRKGEIKALVATDVVARGIDIPTIQTVINFDTAKDISIHTHRIGRTGRAGNKTGIAYTLLTKKETRFASALVKNLTDAKQEVPAALLEVASRYVPGKGRGRKGGAGSSIAEDTANYRGRGRGGIGSSSRGGRGGGRGSGSNYMMGSFVKSSSSYSSIQ